jgi:hypothetical protein
LNNLKKLSLSIASAFVSYYGLDLSPLKLTLWITLQCDSVRPWSLKEQWLVLWERLMLSLREHILTTLSLEGKPPIFHIQLVVSKCSTSLESLFRPCCSALSQMITSHHEAICHVVVQQGGPHQRSPTATQS